MIPLTLIDAPDYIVVFSILGLFFYTALLLSLVLTPVSNKIAHILGILDLPDSRKVHTRSVPRLGGLAMATSLFLSLLLCIRFTSFYWAYILGASVIVFVGLIDDKITISPRLKFMGEILAVLIFILMSQNQLTGFGNILGLGPIKTYSLAVPVTIIAMVGLINALNLSDGLDGLAAGISVVACIFFLSLSYESQHWQLLSLSVILLGVILGFLRYNSHPAKLFMGDSGSLLLGYSLSCIAVSIVQNSEQVQVQISPVTVFILLSLPIVDTLYVMTKRICHGMSPVSPDKTHFHHRLMGIGFSQSTVVAIIYGMMFAFGFLSWGIHDWLEWKQFYLILIIYLTLYFLLWIVEKKGIPNIKLPSYSIKNTENISMFKLLSTWVGRTNKYVPYVFSLLLIAPAFFLPTASGSFALFALAVSFFVVLFYPWKGKTKEMRLGNGLVFISVFSLLLLYLFNRNFPYWLPYYLLGLSLLAFIWVILRIVFKRRYQVILPTSFELLLISISWFIPLVWGQVVDLDMEIRQRLLITCALSVPIMAGSKAMLRRHAKRNKKFLLLLLGGIFYIAVKSLLSIMY